MRFNIFSSILSLAAIAAPLVAAGIENNENIITKPAVGDVWVAGKPFPIIWTPSAAAGTVSIILLKGVPSNFQVVETIAPTVANNGKFEWTPPINLEGLQTMPADQVYGFKIVSDNSGNFGFSPGFKIDSPASTFKADVTASISSAAPSSSAPPASTSSTATETVPSATSTVSSAVTSTVATSSAASSSSISTGSTASSVVSSTSSASVQSSSTSSQTTLATQTKTSSVSSSKTTKPSTSTSSASEKTSSTSIPQSGFDTPNPTPSQKLGSGAIAGITAGVIAVIVFIVLAIFFFRRRQQHSRTKLISTPPSTSSGGAPAGAPSKYDRDFQMMERRARHRPTSSFGFNTTRSDASGGIGDRTDPYVALNDRDSLGGSSFRENTNSRAWEHSRWEGTRF
ncbi:hypothetical protein ABW20_dc0103814 [Dactylellina cionopaga]|nr:hypothetical protein ABW20_dc0103814 [Dactylellina cionopaga]